MSTPDAPTQFEPGAPPDHERRIGPYRLVREVGHGGMGAVFLAVRDDDVFQKRVAVKVLKRGMDTDAIVRRFRHERQILAGLDHPNIARLIDGGTTDGLPYFVMEFVDGAPLTDYCDQHQLDTTARLDLFQQVCAAVQYAHQNLVIHRDIKPANVLVTSDGLPKLLDFGIAKLLSHDHDTAAPLSQEGARALTPEFAAPEQLTGGTVTTATDVHALGLLLYVLLGGPNPAAGTSGSAADLIRVIVETEPPRLSQVAPAGRQLRGDIDNIVAKALRKQPSERYASATAFGDDLRRYLRREPVRARPDTLLYHASKFLQRRARPLAAALAVAVLVAGLVGYGALRLARERDVARLEADKSARMADLLTTLLTGADPYGSRDAEPTVRGLLDAGAARVRAELGDQPALRAEMLTVIGRVYLRLGQLETARPLLEEAVEAGRGTGGATPRLAAALNELGVVYRERGDTAGATPVLEEALAMRRQVLGPRHPDVAITLVELARVFEDQVRLDRAEPLYREALDIRREAFGEHHRETSTSEAGLALVLLRRGEMDQAEPLFRQALATSRAELGEDHPNVAAGWNNLGLLLMTRGDAAGAEPMVRRALDINRRSFGTRHPNLLNNLTNLAAILYDEQRYAEAAAMAIEGLEIAHGGGEGQESSIARLSFQLGRVRLAQHRPAEAEVLLREAVDLQTTLLPAGDWILAASKSALGEALIDEGRFDEAERLLSDATGVLRDVPGREGREAAATRGRLDRLARARAAVH
ncbi:MAG: serine/threonine-protein kinase [Vicinamibacterales bacterium]